MATPHEIVMNSRKELVDALIKNMEKGYFWTEHAWDSAALRPYNPTSNCYYHGSNRARLMLATMQNNYNDPRWCTFNQAKANGWEIRRGAKSVLLEKWIFTETKTVENEHGELVKETVDLKSPKVNYFRVFNANQIYSIPRLEAAPAPDYDSIIKTAAQSSQCPIVEKAVPEAHYIPSHDIIEIPSRFAFKSAESYLSVQIHEMSHSTGHPDRLNRPILNKFGTPDYAREELRAELGSAFFKCNLNLPLSNEQLQDHSNYLKSWIQVLKDDPNEFFKACQDAEKISDYLQKNYEQVLEHELQQEQFAPPKQINLEETEQELSNDIATNIGNIPIEDYREIIAMQNGFDSYKEMLDAEVVIDLEESHPRAVTAPLELAELNHKIITEREHIHEVSEPSEEPQPAPMEQHEYMSREAERQLVPKSFWTINILHPDIPHYYDTLEDALHDYFTQPLSQQTSPYDSRGLGIFFDAGHEYSILQREYGVDIVNPDRFDDPELKPFLEKINEKLLEYRNPDETYLDRISLQLKANGLHMTNSLKENLEALHANTGEEYYIRDLAGIPHSGIDFGESQQFADEIYAECRQQEWEHLQELVADVEV